MDRHCELTSLADAFADTRKGASAIVLIAEADALLTAQDVRAHKRFARLDMPEV
jgi:hypothetical protein